MAQLGHNVIVKTPGADLAGIVSAVNEDGTCTVHTFDPLFAPPIVASGVHVYDTETEATSATAEDGVLIGWLVPASASTPAPEPVG